MTIKNAASFKVKIIFGSGDAVQSVRCINNEVKHRDEMFVEKNAKYTLR